MFKTYSLILVLFLSCSSGSKIYRPKISPEIPIAILHKRGIVPSSKRYKQSYHRILPYLFVNGGDNFNKISGDFFNVKYKKKSDLNIAVDFFSEYGEHKNSLIVLIARTSTSSLPLDKATVSVVSSIHGVLVPGKLWGDAEINKQQGRILFMHELQLENKFDVINKIKNDLITLIIDGEVYEFISPEFELD